MDGFSDMRLIPTILKNVLYHRRSIYNDPGGDFNAGFGQQHGYNQSAGVGDDSTRSPVIRNCG